MNYNAKGHSGLSGGGATVSQLPEEFEFDLMNYNTKGHSALSGGGAPV